MNTQSEEQYRRMTSEPVGRLIVSLALPSTVTMLIGSLYNLADTFFVGRLGTSATAAVGVVFSVNIVLNALGFWVGTGGSSLVSRLLGAQKNEQADRMANTAFLLSFVFGAAVGAAGLAAGDGLLRALGATPSILPYARQYAFYIYLSAPFTACNLALAQCLRAEGRSRECMVGQMSGGVLNMLLDPVFIFGFGLNIAGAAIATALSQAVSWGLLLGYYLRGKTQVRLSPRLLLRGGAQYTELFAMGFPSVCRHLCMMLSNVALNLVAGGWGDVAIAAMSVAGRLLYLSNAVAGGLNHASQPVLGYAHGRGDYARVKQAFWFAVRFSMASMCCFGVLGIVFAPQLIALFRNDPEVVRIGAGALRMICLALPLANFMNASSTLFQMVGRPVPSSLLTVLRQVVFYIPALVVLARVWQVTGLQMAGPVADALVFCVALPMVLRYFRKYH